MFTDIKSSSKTISHEAAQAPVAAACIEYLWSGSINVLHGVYELCVTVETYFMIIILSQCPQSSKWRSTAAQLNIANACALTCMCM